MIILTLGFCYVDDGTLDRIKADYFWRHVKQS
jgi:hypothetical protein